MGILLEYIKNIGYFLILMSLVSNVMPDNSYKKYCRMFCGLILVVLVINPFYEFLNYEGDIEDIFSTISYESGARELENQIRIGEKGTKDKVINEYEKLIINELQGSAREEGLYIMEAKVELTEGEEIKLTRLNLVVTEKMNLMEGEENKDVNKQENIEQGTKVKIENIRIGEVKEENVQSYTTNPRILSFLRKAAEHLQLEESIFNIELYKEAENGE